MLLWQLFGLCLPLVCHGTSKMSPMLFQCDKWDKEYPEENDVTKGCEMTVRQQDADEFLFRLRKSEFTTRLFKFNLLFENRETFKTNCVIQPLTWIWTFPGEKGAISFLNWPKEYRVWSMGLLDLYSFGPMNISINATGECPVIIGQNETTQRIGLTLIRMVNKAANLPGANVEYGYGYVCYNERIFIQSPALYSLCLHIVCPLEALGYKCCRTEYVLDSNLTRVVCDGEITHYDEAWWVVPFLIGILMFAYVPIILLKSFKKISGKTEYHLLNLLEENTSSDDKWLITNPLTFLGIIRTIFVQFGESFPRLSGICLRIIIVLSSLTILLIQILVHYFYDYEYTVDLVKGGVPLGFRSMVVGYRKSKSNFMPRLGGPYVALEVYILTTVFLVCIPRNLESFIEKGIPNNDQLSVSPLTIDLKTRGVLGAVFDIERQSGYYKMFSLMKVHIFMLINPSFWRLAIQMQFRRFWGLLNIISSNKTLKCILLILLFIPYVCIFCVIELTLTVVYYGFPIFLFFQVTVCAFCVGIKSKLGNLGTFGKLLQYTFTLLVVGILVFNIYILTVVFVDSFHFLSRIIMFTFTGLIAYPSTTYGYFVFAIMILIYVTEAIQQIRLVYSHLFTYVRKCSVKIHKRNLFPHIPMIRKEGGYNMVSRELFFFVVSRHKPIRVELFFSFLKLVFITFLLYLAIHTIVKLQGLWNINPLTQVLTAIFICLIPKLWHKMMIVDEYLFDMRETLTVTKLIVDYCRQKLHCREYSVNNVASDDENPDLDENRTLLGHPINRGYNTMSTHSDVTEDDEMRSELLLDLANEL